ncbi:hypothetical protein [Kitasatospora sp. NPDC098663]|uniref:hypothetical protein n=1 Tax=Kitasatospora sp. NPDC098663 TaxID=3364096 RepID=UPI0037F8BA47
MEKIFPTERAVPGQRLRIVTTLLWPVTGLCTGTPVLVRKLMAPRHQRRAEAAALTAKREQLAADVAEVDLAAFAKKLSAEVDPLKRAALVNDREAARITVREVEVEQLSAARKATFEKAKEAAGGAALLLVLGGPLIWSLARPWIGPGVGLLVGTWWIAALIHAPSPVPKTSAEDATPADTEHDDEDDQENDEEDADDDQDEPHPALPPTLTDTELTTTVEHMVALRARRDEGRGHVHLSELLIALKRHDRYCGYTAREFGAAVRAAGLPVERRVRVGKDVSPGLTYKGLQAHLGHPPRLPAHAVPQPAPEPVPAGAV